MAHPNEITIRVSSPILFIDDDSPSPEPSGHESMRNLTVVNRRTFPQDTSSDTSPMPSLGSKAPIAKQEQLSEGSRHKSRKQQFELTIRGENTVINIQTSSPRGDKFENDNNELYEFINKRVQQVFQTPEREEIEKALEDYQDSKKTRIFTKKSAWKMLSAKSSKRSREREERYPSIVLLQDPPKPKIIEESYPKMFYVQEDNQKIEKPKFDYRSKSMLSLREHVPNFFTPSMSDLCYEKQNMALERCYLEKERESLAEERAGLEKGKNKIEKQKQSLERSKSFLIQDQNILKEKKQILRYEKASLLGENDSDGNLLKKEKLCLKFAKQLIEDEKKIMDDEKNILYKEKEMIKKEKDILGNEKNVLDEERVILSKEKSNLEKQQTIVGEGFFKHDEIDNTPHDDVMNEIEDVFHESCELSRNQGKLDFRPSSSPSVHFQNSFSPCNLNSQYPVYVPVYNLPRPYLPHYRPCCGQEKRARNIQTQTENIPILPSDGPENSLPINLLSGIFPRVVITSMNNFSHGPERSDDPKNNLFREIIKEESSPGPSKTRQKKVKKVVKTPKKTVVVPKKLELPPPDLSLKAKSTAAVPKHSDSFEDPESGIQTFTSEVAIKDDFSPVSDETMSVETIHFGYSDDFYSNEALFPAKPTSTRADTKKLPLTSAGHEIYEKLTKLSLQQPDNSKIDGTEEKENIDNSQFPLNFNLNLHLSDASIQLSLPGNISMNLNSNTRNDNVNPYCKAGIMKLQSENESEKCFVKRSELWYSPDSISDTNKFNPTKMKNNEISLQISNGSSVHFQQGVSNIDLSVCGSKNTKCDAYVGPDHKEETNGYCQQKQLSPRTSDLLEALRKKLEFSESERKIISYGKPDSDKNKTWEQNSVDKNFSGLFLVHQLQKNQKFKETPHFFKPPEKKAEPREYLCEECLATMRLYEDDFQSVQNIINKFENINRFGFK